MGGRTISIKESVAEQIAAIALFIEAKGMLATAEKFSNQIYDHCIKLSDLQKSYPRCKDPVRSLLNY